MSEAAAPFQLVERIEFDFVAPLDQAAALLFVRDVHRSLAGATFLEGLSVSSEQPPQVSARLPVNTPLFGRRELPFVSELHHTHAGARLKPLPVRAPGRGWAEVGGEAVVAALDGAAGGASSRISYALDLGIFLDLPEADRWGTRALMKMIELTAGSVLKLLGQRFPAAIEGAARSGGAAGSEA